MLPINNKNIPYGRQWIDENDVKAVIDALFSDYLTTGPKIKEFEQKFAEYVGAKYAVAVANGTAALHVACLAADIGKGDEVITTPITFAASSNCVLYCGARPVFADINSSTYNIDPENIRKKITKKTKAIIPVHFTGQPCDMEEIHKIAEEHNLIVLEDAAHALGAEYKGKKIGSISDMTTFSFHPVKHITTGEGGMVTTNDLVLYQRLLLFRSHGITRDKELLDDQEAGSWYYEQHDLGYNFRITDIQCALGISQLKKAQHFVDRRREIANIYNEAFKNLKGVVTPYQEEHRNSSWHLYVIRLKRDLLRLGRKEIFDALKNENIGVNVHYIPIYYFPYYQRLGYVKGICQNAEALYEDIITIPLFPQMSDQDVDIVIQKVCKIINSCTLLFD